MNSTEDKIWNSAIKEAMKHSENFACSMWESDAVPLDKLEELLRPEVEMITEQWVKQQTTTTLKYFSPMHSIPSEAREILNKELSKRDECYCTDGYDMGNDGTCANCKDR